MWRITLLLLLVLAAAPRPGSAQARVDSVLSARRGPIQMLLEHRERLGLSAEQVRRLETIGARMHDRNRPLVERFLEIRQRWERERPTDWRGLSTEQRREARTRFQRGIREETRELREQIQRNEREAMLEVRAVLTGAQKEKVRQIIRAERQLPADSGARSRSR